MAFTLLGNSNIAVDLTKISAKTHVTQNYGADQWTFQVLVDGQWIILSYDNEADADSMYDSLT
jgi:hypothetical protein